MDPDRLAEAESIFLDAIGLPANQRRELLSERCGDDAGLRAFVERLLEHHDGAAKDFLKPVEVEPEAAAESPQPLPERIGSYKILRRLGEGGMGEVFEAEQEKPVHRRVALKIMKRGMDTREVLARFEAERQALALMDHPGIAKVLDAGETEHGRPYFVMDLIHGVPINEYCDRQRLTTKERLDLFVHVCQAIQHAHTKGVIHRDVKPSNVLVTTVDGRPVPKVIDFGIAKATAQSLTEKTLYTVQGQIIGTPVYMSPEQLEMTGLGVDTRTDVYSLGVLLYELLTGSLPFETTTLQEAGFEGMRRIIREEDPPKPSTRISTLGEKAATAATQRRTDPGRLGRMVHGELDWITMRALEKDPARRYQSPSAMAEDVERYQRDEAVLAGPPSKAYQLKKLVARHKVPVAFGAAILVLLLGFAISMGVLRESAEKARAEAQDRAEELELVTEFQKSMLSEIDIEEAGRALFADLRERVQEALAANGASPEETEVARKEFDHMFRGVNATDVAVEMIDEQVLSRAVKTIEEQFADQSLVLAALQQTVADTYHELGRYEPAVPLQEAALEIHRGMLGDDHPKTLTSIGYMSTLLQSMGELDSALVYCREALEGRRRVLGDEHSETLESIDGMGSLLQAMGRFDEALAYHREALEGFRRTLGDEDPETLTSLACMGSVHSRMGALDSALVYHQEALVGRRRVLGNDHMMTLTSISHMGHLLWSMNKNEDALGYFQEALEGFRRTLGDHHPMTLVSMNNMGSLLYNMRKLDEALVYHQEALQGQRHVLGDDHPTTLSSIDNMGLILRYMGRLDEALACFREALEGEQRVLGNNHPSTLHTLTNVGGLLQKMGQLDSALVYLQESLEGRRRVLGEDHYLTLITLTIMGLVLRDQGKPEAVVALYAPAEAAARRVFGEIDRRRLVVFLGTLGQARQATGAFNAAENDLTDAYAIECEMQNATERQEKVMTYLVDLYESWHAAEPGNGYDAKAAEWRAKLEEVRESMESEAAEAAQ